MRSAHRWHARVPSAEPYPTSWYRPPSSSLNRRARESLSELTPPSSARCPASILLSAPALALSVRRASTRTPTRLAGALLPCLGALSATAAAHVCCRFTLCRTTSSRKPRSRRPRTSCSPRFPWVTLQVLRQHRRSQASWTTSLRVRARFRTTRVTHRSVCGSSTVKSILDLTRVWVRLACAAVRRPGPDVLSHPAPAMCSMPLRP